MVLTRYVNYTFQEETERKPKYTDSQHCTCLTILGASAKRHLSPIG